MTIQSKRGKNTKLRGTQISQSPGDRAAIKQHRDVMAGNEGAKLVGYHKRRRRSTWLLQDGKVIWVGGSRS